VFATISSRCSSASTDSIPNIARPSIVSVSMPCSITCRPIFRVRPERHQVQHRPGQPIEAGDLQRVALAQQLQDEVELRPRGLRPGRRVEMDAGPVDSGSQERVDPMIGILVRCRYPRVAKVHASRSTP
jgi:hypothetical protein